MVMPGRSYSATNNYRYGFNGKEKDKDISSTTAYDYGFRIYSPAIGKFLSVDPLTKKYSELTPYQFASDGPIWAIDLDGLEKYTATMQCFAPYEVFGANFIEEPGIPPFISPTLVYYKGDGNNRKFGDGGTYRTSSSMTVDFDNPTQTTTSEGTTTSIKYENGVAVKIDESPSHIEVEVKPQLKTTKGGSKELGFAFHTYGSNQVSTMGKHVDIDNHLSVKVTKNAEGNQINIQGEGNGDRFPSGEAFIQDASGNKIMLGGSGHNGPDQNLGPFINLPGDNKRSMFKFNFDVNVNSKGDFESVNFKDKSGKVTTYSITDWNAMFQRLDPKNTNVSTNVSTGETMNFYDKVPTNGLLKF
jgi:RHS repeat-associated protein